MQSLMKSLTLFGALAVSGANAADVRFNADLLTPSCLLERVSRDQIAVDCPPEHPGYQFSTLLADTAVLPGRRTDSPVRLFLSKTAIDCSARGELNALDPRRLSSQRPHKHNNGAGRLTWFYCLQSAQPLNGEIEVQISAVDDALPVAARWLDVHFAHDSAEISQQVQSQIQTFLAQSGELSKYRVEIQAHSSEIGDAAHNDKLSKARLSSIRAYLLMATPWTQTEIKGASFGESRPFLLHPDASSHQWNRRASIILLPKE